MKNQGAIILFVIPDRLNKTGEMALRRLIRIANQHECTTLLSKRLGSQVERAIRDVDAVVFVPSSIVSSGGSNDTWGEDDSVEVGIQNPDPQSWSVEDFLDDEPSGIDKYLRHARDVRASHHIFEVDGSRGPGKTAELFNVWVRGILRRPFV